MNRTTALLMLGAILLIVVNLLGEGGAVSRVAGMEKTQIASAVDTIGDTATRGAGFAGSAAPDDATGEVVRPAVVDDDGAVVEDLIDQSEIDTEFDEPIASGEESNSSPAEMKQQGFDPRIG